MKSVPWLEKKDLWLRNYLEEKRDWLTKLVELVRPGAGHLAELAEMMAPFISGQVVYAQSGQKIPA